MKTLSKLLAAAAMTVSASQAPASTVLVKCAEKYSNSGLHVTVTQDRKGYISGWIKKEFARDDSETLIRVDFLRQISRVDGGVTYSSFDDGRFYLTRYGNGKDGELTYIYGQHRQETVALRCR